MISFNACATNSGFATVIKARSTTVIEKCHIVRLSENRAINEAILKRTGAVYFQILLAIKENELN